MKKLKKQIEAYKYQIEEMSLKTLNPSTKQLILMSVTDIQNMVEKRLQKKKKHKKS